jgi:hypothetical protein
MTATPIPIPFDRSGESPIYTSPRYPEGDVFFRWGEQEIALAYAVDGSPTNGSEYETFATEQSAAVFAAAYGFVETAGEAEDEEPNNPWQALALRAGMAASAIAELGTADRARAHDLFGYALDQMRDGTLVLSDPDAAHAGFAATVYEELPARLWSRE